jgi:hypothetical protein
MPAFDPEAGNAPVTTGAHPSRGNALLGPIPLIPTSWLPPMAGRTCCTCLDAIRRSRAVSSPRCLTRIISARIFVDDRLGSIAGTLPLSSINLKGSAAPVPSIVVIFRSATTGCAIPTNCQVEVADTTLQQGQGMHGSFGRGDTLNFTAAIGP